MSRVRELTRAMTFHAWQGEEAHETHNTAAGGQPGNVRRCSTTIAANETDSIWLRSLPEIERGLTIFAGAAVVR